MRAAKNILRHQYEERPLGRFFDTAQHISLRKQTKSHTQKFIIDQLPFFLFRLLHVPPSNQPAVRRLLNKAFCCL